MAFVIHTIKGKYMLLSEVSTFDLMDEDDCIKLDTYIVQAAKRVLTNARRNSNIENDSFVVARTPSFNDIISSLYSQAENMLKKGMSLDKVLNKLQNVG